MDTKALENSKNVKKNISILLLGKFVSLFGSQIFNFAMGLYILKVTGSATSFGISLLVSALPRVVLSPFAGIFSDRFDRKKTVVYSDIISGLIVMGLYTTSLFTNLNIVFIYISMFLLSVFNVFFAVAIDASIPNIANKDNLTKVNSLSQSITSAALIFAPILGGVMIAIFDIKVFILINAVSFFLSGISEKFIDLVLKICRLIIKKRI